MCYFQLLHNTLISTLYIVIYFLAKPYQSTRHFQYLLRITSYLFRSLSLVVASFRLKGACLNLQDCNDPEDEGSRFPRNVGISHKNIYYQKTEYHNITSPSESEHLHFIHSSASVCTNFFNIKRHIIVLFFNKSNIKANCMF